MSGLFGSTAIVKELKPRNALVAGMALYCGYVAAFWIATRFPAVQNWAAALGALTGGVGAGFLWTAQGAYFAAASNRMKAMASTSMVANNDRDDVPPEEPRDVSIVDDPSGQLAGIFAFIYLFSEVLLRSLSSLLLHVMSWTGIFAFYSTVAVVSTLGMATFVDAVENQTHSSSSNDDQDQQSLWFKATAAYRLLRNDPKMKYLIPTTALFGWASAFLSSYVNGEVVHMVLHQDNSIGWLTAWVSCAAALASLCYGRIPAGHKEAILAFGALCFAAIALIFVITPRLQSISTLILVYTLHGLGRATFEGTLRSAVDLFEDKEGAFANIILQNGTATAIGFLLSFHLRCESSATNPYCIEYRDGSRHNVLIYEVLILVTAALSIWGFRQAMIIEADQESEEQTPLVDEAGLEECAGLVEVSPTQ
jgi:Ion channel regulatory protein UNC-93